MARGFGREHTQADERRSYNATDQFGRKYLMVVEKSTGDCVGSPIPCFTDPLATPGKYVRQLPGQPYTVEVRFGQWIADLEQAWDYRQAQADELRQQLAGDKAQVDRQMKRILGPEPLDPEIIRKAEAGDRELLGLEAAVAVAGKGR